MPRDCEIVFTKFVDLVRIAAKPNQITQPVHGGGDLDVPRSLWDDFSVSLSKECVSSATYVKGTRIRNWDPGVIPTARGVF